MADIASQLLEFPPETFGGKQLSSEDYDKRIRAFLNSLSQLSPNKVATADADQDLLEILDPSVNSISYLFILRSRIDGRGSKSKTVQSNDSSHFKKALEFLTGFDGKQIRYVGPEFSSLISFVINHASRANMLPAVVVPTRTALFRLDSSAGTLTSTHLTFLRICLQTRCLQEALPLAQTVIHSFPASKPSGIDGQYICSPHTDSSNYITESSGLTEKLAVADVQEYFLSVALVFIGLERWDDALVALECVLTSPSSGAPSGLMLEAYQKWVLVGCLVHGRSPDPPKTFSMLMRTLKPCSKAYDNLAEIFQAGDLRRLQAEISAGSNIWFEDANTGLVQQLTTHLPRFYVLGLQKTYSAIPLSTVARWLNRRPDEAHAFIEGLITAGALNASIDLRDGADKEAVLRFYSNQSSGPLAKSEKEYYAELVAQTVRTNTMVDYVKMADRRLVLTKEYIDNLRKRMRSKEEDGPVSAEGMDTAWDASGYQDEDLMLDS